MAYTKMTQSNTRRLSYGSILLAFLGVAFYWWVPMGLVLSLAGLLVGFVDWTFARWRSLDYRLSILGILLCIAALIVDGLIVYLGMQIVTFGGP